MNVDFYSVTVVARTDIGRFRSNNEDSFAIGKYIFDREWTATEAVYDLQSTGSVFVIADGMGGTDAGELAAQIAVQSVQKQFQELFQLPENQEEIFVLLRNIIFHAHEEIVAFVELNKRLKGMGTTLVVGWLLKNELYVAWCGDSRCYVAQTNQHAHLFTEDHSKVWEMVKQGLITPEQARTHPQSHVITQALGDAKFPPKPDFKLLIVNELDRFLFCSDGLNTMLSDEEIFEMLENRQLPLKETADYFVSRANEAGGKDNITLILVETSLTPTLS
jgi:protein phosphatase